MDLNYQLRWQQFIRRGIGDKGRLKKTKGVALAVVACFVASVTSADVVALYTFDDASDLGANSGLAPCVWNRELGASSTNGVFGGAGAFVAGTSSYWLKNFGRASTDLGNFSVSMHVRGTGVARGAYLSIGARGSFIVLEQTDSGSVAVISVGGPDGPVVHIEGMTAVNDGNWHHLGLVGDGTGITLYIDGVMEGNAVVYNARRTIVRLQLASQLSAPARAITADLDDVGIFDRALTPAEISYFSSNAIPEPAATGFATAETVDPCFPHERSTALPEKWSRLPWTRIQQLEAERDQLLKKISVLPQHDPQILTGHAGHGGGCRFWAALCSS